MKKYLIGALAPLALLVLLGATSIKSSDATVEMTIDVSEDDDLTDEALDMRGRTVVGIQYATMTSTSLTAKCAEKKGGTYVDLYDADNAQWSITIADDQVHDLTQGGKAISGCRWLKFATGSNEGSDRTLYVTIAG